jgi:hypothetical protein
MRMKNTSIGVEPRSFRTRSIGAKVTDGEYATLLTAARGQTFGVWIRKTLLAAATSPPVDRVLLAELLALRAIVVTLHFAVATGEPMTPEALQRVIDRADQDKLIKARERLEPSSQGTRR